MLQIVTFSSKFNDSIEILRLEGMTNDNSAEKKGLVHATQSDGPHPSSI